MRGGAAAAAQQDMRVVRGVAARLSIPSLVTGSSSILGWGKRLKVKRQCILSCPLASTEKVKGSTVLSPWVILCTLPIPSGELPRNSAEADQNPKSLGGGGVDRKMERQVS